MKVMKLEVFVIDFDRVARQTPPFMAGKDSADSNAVVKSDCL